MCTECRMREIFVSAAGCGPVHARLPPVWCRSPAAGIHFPVPKTATEVGCGWSPRLGQWYVYNTIYT